MQDEELAKEVNKIMNGEIVENFSITKDVVLTMKGKVCVPCRHLILSLIEDKGFATLLLCLYKVLGFL